MSMPMPKPQPAARQPITDALRACYPPQGVIADYLNWASRLTHAPPQLHLAAMLPAVAFEANKRGFVFANGDPLNVWVMIIAPPGAGKTTALSFIRDVHESYGLSTHGATWQTPWESAEGSLPGVAEALTTHYDGTDPSASTNAILYHTEVSKILRQEDSYEWLCQLYDKGDIKRNLRYIQKRKADGEEVQDTVRNVKVSAFFTTVRASFQEVFRETFLRGGFASRMLWFTGRIKAEDLMPRRLSDEDGKQAVIRSFQKWAASLDAMTLYTPLGPKGTRPLRTSPSALATHQDYFDSMRELIVDPTEEWSALGNRACDYALKIGALYALVNGRHEIAQDDMQRAVALMRYLFVALEQVLPTLRPEDRFQRHIRRVREVAWAYIASYPQANNLVPKQTFMRGVSSLSAQEFEHIAKTLIERGFMEEVHTAYSGLGRPGKVFRILQGPDESS